MAGRPPVLLPAAQDFGMDAQALVRDARAALRSEPERAAMLLAAVDLRLRLQQRALARLERSGRRRTPTA